MLRLGGAEGNRTPDLCSAIAALSHLSYGPAPSARDSSNTALTGPAFIVSPGLIDMHTHLPTEHSRQMFTEEFVLDPREECAGAGGECSQEVEVVAVTCDQVHGIEALVPDHDAAVGVARTARFSRAAARAGSPVVTTRSIDPRLSPSKAPPMSFRAQMGSD